MERRLILPVLQLHLVAQCNLSCRGCNHASPGLDKDLVAEDDFLEALRHLRRLGIATERLYLMGGEPTLHPGIDRLCAAAKDAGIGPVIVLTNGTLLKRMTPAFWEAADRVQISLYPGQEITWPEEHAHKIRTKQFLAFREVFSTRRNEDPALLMRIWDDCRFRNRTFGVVGGKFYKCMRAAYLRRALPVREADGIDLAGATIERILDYIRDDEPLGACAFCAGSMGRRFPHQQASRAEFLALQDRPISQMVRSSAGIRRTPARLVVESGVHRLVRKPIERTDRPRLTSQIHRRPSPPDANPGGGWESRHLFRGATPHIADFRCHVSVLARGESPHPPHAHPAEEILIVLSGEVDLILPAEQATPEGERRRLRRGQFVYYPSSYPHTLEGASEATAQYLMFKWRADPTGEPDPMHCGVFSALERSPETDDPNPHGFRVHHLFSQPTAWLRKLGCHTSALAPGGGYEPHADAYDVAILVLDGEVETLGERVHPGGVIFYAAGEPHGMRNPGKTPAHYVVFAFHARRTAPKARKSRAMRGQPMEPPRPKPKKSSRSWLEKLTDGRRWKRRLRRWLGQKPLG